MNLIEKLPDLDDEGVHNLLANARRLEQSGNDKQRAASAEILPALEAEAARRVEERRTWLAERRAAAARARRKPAAQAQKAAS